MIWFPTLLMVLGTAPAADTLEPAMKKTFESVRQCLPTRGAESLMACLQPYVTAQASPAQVARLSLHLGAFESMTGLRVCTPLDLQRFPIEADQARSSLLCSTGKKRKRSEPILWKFREEQGRWMISDVKLR